MSKKSYRILFGYNRKCSVRKDVLRNFAKFTRKHLWQSLFFNLFYRTPLDDCFCKQYFPFQRFILYKYHFLIGYRIKISKKPSIYWEWNISGKECHSLSNLKVTKVSENNKFEPWADQPVLPQNVTVNLSYWVKYIPLFFSCFKKYLYMKIINKETHLTRLYRKRHANWPYIQTFHISYITFQTFYRDLNEMLLKLVWIQQSEAKSQLSQKLNDRINSPFMLYTRIFSRLSG